MREITFKMTFRDWQEGVRLGLSPLTSFYQAFWSGFLLLMTVGLLLILWSKGYPANWPPTQLPPRPVLLSIASLLGVMVVSYGSVTVLIGCLPRTPTVQILPLHLAIKCRIWSSQIRWKNVTAVVNTGEHLCFCQNFPLATVIPRSAFPNQEQADAFFEQAQHYWRRETGRKAATMLEPPGVWPPAPHVPQSQERDKTP